MWEMWRRLPPSSFTVLTIEHPEAAAFDAAQAFRVVRVPVRMLLPTPSLGRRIRALAVEVGADLVVFDPAVPVGMLGPHLGIAYGVVLHGAEVSVPGQLPLARGALARVLRRADPVLINSEWVGQAASRVVAPLVLPLVMAAPGVDHTRFVPLRGAEREAARQRLGLPKGGELILGVGRLVPRKGASTLIEAVSSLVSSRPGLYLAIAGGGRQEACLARLAYRAGPSRQAGGTGAYVKLLGRVPDADLPDLYGCADLFAQPTRTRWAGLEQEGFGIVFLEAAACGIPVVAGRSGGAAEAVIDGVTGLVVDSPRDRGAVADAIRQLLDDGERRKRMGAEARRRVEEGFTYDLLARALADTLGQTLHTIPQ